MKFILNYNDINYNDKFISLYFYAKWFKQHDRVFSILNKMEKEYPCNIYAIDVDAYKNICEIHSINSVPTVLIISKGKELKRINGVAYTSGFRRAFYDVDQITSKADI